MSVKQRLIEYIRYRYISIRQFEIKLGFSNGFVNNIRRSISPGKIERIASLFDDLDISWLVTGNGQMLKESSVSKIAKYEAKYIITKNNYIPLIDSPIIVSEECETDMNFSYEAKAIDVVDILRDSEAAMRLYGDSMIPGYPSGSVIGLKKSSESFIEPGSIYVIETDVNIYMKRLYYNEDKTSFIAHSDNHAKYTEGPRVGTYLYPEFEIPIEEVRKIFIVTGVIKRDVNGSILQDD